MHPCGSRQAESRRGGEMEMSGVSNISLRWSNLDVWMVAHKKTVVWESIFVLYEHWSNVHLSRYFLSQTFVLPYNFSFTLKIQDPCTGCVTARRPQGVLSGKKGKKNSSVHLLSSMQVSTLSTHQLVSTAQMNVSCLWSLVEMWWWTLDYLNLPWFTHWSKARERYVDVSLKGYM